MKKIKLLVNLWLPVIIWCGLIFYLSSFPSPPPMGNLFFDLFLPYFAHLVEYSVLFILAWRATKNIYLSLLLAIFYAFSDEFHQSFVPSRTSSLFDVSIDILGIGLGWLGVWKLLPKAPEKLKNWAKKLGVI